MLEEIDRENRSEANRTTGFEKKKYANLKKYRQLFVEEVKKNFARENWKIFIPKRNRCNGIQPLYSPPLYLQSRLCNPAAC